MPYQVFPILPVARKSGLPVSDRSTGTVHINCPFCGDTKRRLYLYTDSQQYHCFHCGTHGNAVSLYARRTGLSYKDAYRELCEDQVLHFPLPAAPCPRTTWIAALTRRDAVYRALLALLPLSSAHTQDLLTRGLDTTAIRNGGYRTLAPGKALRDTLAAALAERFDLAGVPGFYFADHAWRLCAFSGLLIPVQTADGRIQGMQIRRGHTDRMKYVWLSSAGLPQGTGARCWVHVAGDRTRREAYITEGPLKGAVSSHLSGGKLFLCVPGVTAVTFLPDTLRTLGVRQVYEAFDMDKRDNPQVHNAVLRLRTLIHSCGISCTPLTWDSNFKGIDDYLLHTA